MSIKILFIERKFNEYVSIEKAFREIAAGLSDEFKAEFQQVPYGNHFTDTLKNLFFFKPKKARIYHITGHIHYIALLFSSRNTILSIMDLRFLHAPKSFRRFVLKKLYLDLPLKRLKHITAISEHTKREIIEFSGCDEKKITTLELPLLRHIFIENIKEFDFENPTILQIGTMPNKNIPNLARALRGIKCKLKIIGRLNNDLISVLKQNQIDFANASDLNDEQLRKEYENADIVSFCSTYEGFGLPIIEAQAMRKPVITSDLSPLKETAGNAAYLADPFSADSIRQGILKIIKDEKYRNALIVNGEKNASRFNAKSISEKYEKFYKDVLKQYEST
ncbi:MAG TPA: glycosyltransferase family 1 protein [Pyrinomonadaceae bacterium]|jgi:glycosyltransferase involved in cell wall biosynthesis